MIVFFGEGGRYPGGGCKYPVTPLHYVKNADVNVQVVRSIKQLSSSHDAVVGRLFIYTQRRCGRLPTSSQIGYLELRPTQMDWNALPVSARENYNIVRIGVA